jgi:HAD superfamily phosphatase (TIGR01668 family)
MPKILPKWYSKSIYDIDLEKLKTLNIKYVLSDLDNTLVGFDVAEPTEKVHAFIKQLKDNDLELIVVSNNNSKRLNKFCNPCALRFLSSTRKPGCKRLVEFLKRNSLNVNECAFVGDQLLTDMWCANKTGCISILVDPLQKKESVFTFFNRRIDRVIRRRYAKKGKLKSIMKGE